MLTELLAELGVNLKTSTPTETVNAIKLITGVEELGKEQKDTLILLRKTPLQPGTFSHKSVIDLLTASGFATLAVINKEFVHVLTPAGYTATKVIDYTAKFEAMTKLMNVALIQPKARQPNETGKLDLFHSWESLQSSNVFDATFMQQKETVTEIPLAADADQPAPESNAKSAEAVFLDYWGGINRTIAEASLKPEYSGSYSMVIKDERMWFNDLWSPDSTVMFSYLNLLTVDNMLEFVSWLNGGMKKPINPDSIFFKLGIWSIIHEGTARADFRLTQVGVQFKDRALSDKIISDLGQDGVPNYGLCVRLNKGITSSHTLAQHRLTHLK